MKKDFDTTNAEATRLRKHIKENAGEMTLTELKRQKQKLIYLDNQSDEMAAKDAVNKTEDGNYPSRLQE